MSHGRLFKILWFTVNLLLLVSLVLLSWEGVQEYYARAYIQGFVDGAVPLQGSPQQKVEAILAWMNNPPARLNPAPQDIPTGTRDPISNLHYTRLLKVCGTSVPVFISAADRSGVSARRLLLLNEKRQTMHVVSEVWLDGRWVIADVTFRTLLRDAQGRLLTKEDLRDPRIFQEATQGISGYNPIYKFDRTVHFRLGRVPFIGDFIREGLDSLDPDWDGRPFLSVLMSRSSLELVVVFSFLLGLSVLARLALGWYGERHWGIRRTRFRDRLLGAARAFLA